MSSFILVSTFKLKMKQKPQFSRVSACLFVCLSIYLSVYISIYVSVCMSICPSICLPVCLYVHLSVCLSNLRIADEKNKNILSIAFMIQNLNQPYFIVFYFLLGAYVNYRHIALLADCMTFSG